MKIKFLEIEGIKYPVKFGFTANLILSKKWKLKTMGAIGKEIAKRLAFKKDKEPTMDQLAYIGDLIHSGLLSKTPDTEITAGDVMDTFMQRPEEMTEFLMLYFESMPNPEAAKKPNPGK